MNGTTVISANSVDYDTAPPNLSIQSDFITETDQKEIELFFDFTEKVLRFSSSDIQITNAEISGFALIESFLRWKITIRAINQGEVSVSVAEGNYVDLLNNKNTKESSFSYFYYLANTVPVSENQFFECPDTASVDYLVGEINASDAENQDLIYEIISGNTDNFFSINDKDGKIYVQELINLGDSEQSSYLLEVAITDNGYYPLTTTVEITINIIRIADDVLFEANNVFSPNSEKNKYWKIKNIAAYRTCELQILDNSGRQVYSRVGYNNDWNGKSDNGETLPEGTYYYIVNCGKNQVYKGFIHLVNK